MNFIKNLILAISFIVTIEIFWDCTTTTTNSTNNPDKPESVLSDNIDPRDSFEYNTASYSLKDLKYVGECILSNRLSNDTLTIELLSELRYYTKSHLEFFFNNDTLNITRIPETRDTVIYNKGKNRYDTVVIVDIRCNIEIGSLNPNYKLETFRFYKRKSKPTTIYVNGKLYKNCPTKDIEFKTYNGKIANRINKNGFKDGLWLQFHENGKIKEVKYYENGMFLKGKTFDINGKDLHYVSESSGRIETLQIDSLI